MTSRELFTVLLSFLVVGPGVSRAQTILEWETNFERGLETARTMGKAVLLDFSASWCKPCEEMDKRVWTDPGLASVLRKHVVPVRVDFDSERKLASRYEVSAIPALVWTDPWGNELGRTVGFTEPARTISSLMSLLGTLPEDFRSVAYFHNRVAQNAKDAPSLVRIAAFYRERNLLIAAESFYKRALDAAGKGKKDPQVAEQAYVGLGLGCLARGELKEARKEFERSLKLPPGPNRPNALYGLFVAHLKLGEEKKAALVLEDLKRGYPNYENLAHAESLLAGGREP